MKQIIVIGSINMDIVNQVEKHPSLGETITGLNTEFNPGGKGGNQAVAAARAGGKVSMIGAIGSDLFGDQLKSFLSKDGINTDYVIRKNCRTGLAFITVNASGENTIVLEKGANGELAVEQISPILKQLAGEDIIILLQNEIPWETNEYVITEAYSRKIPVYLNSAPARRISNDILSRLSGLFVNETEAEALTGLPVTNSQNAREVAVVLLNTGLKEVIITLGEKGSYFADHNGNSIFTSAHQVLVKDTTAAGDTFIGTYVVARSLDYTLEGSLQFATAASAFTVKHEGAQNSIPYREQIVIPASMQKSSK